MMSKFANVFLGVAAAGFLVGCGKGDSSSSGGSAAPAPTVQSAPALNSQQPGVVAAPAPAGVSAPGAVAPPANAAPAGSFAIDFAAERKADEKGQAMSDLELLNEALIRYGDPAARAKGGAESVPIIPQLKGVQDLVTAGIIKAAPVPPAGKEYVIDNNTRKFVLKDKK